MGDIKKLKLSRRNLKGHLTRALTTLDNLGKDDLGDVITFKKYISKAEEQFECLEKKHAELIEAIEDDTEFESEQKWMNECEAMYVQTLIQARRNLDSCSQTTSDAREPGATASSHQQTHTGNTNFQEQSPSQPSQTRVSLSSTPKMARMKFPSFSGDLRDYRRFKELFVHCAGGLTEIECFYQLTESMVNSRERNMIKGCVSVARAWEILDEYYGDPDKVVDSLLKELDDLKPYEHKGKISLPAMERFVQTLQTFETQAETVGLEGELNSKIMLSNIRQKLPEEHRIAFFKSVRDEHTPNTLTGLVKWLYSHLLLLDKARLVLRETPAPSENVKNSRCSNSATIRSSSKQHDEGSYGKGSQFEVPKCALHKDSRTHYLKTCQKFKGLDLTEKYDVMKKNNICNRCGHNNCVAGKPPYDLGSCQFVAPCSISTCGSDYHFAAICPVVYGRNTSPQSHCENSEGLLNVDAGSFIPDPKHANVSTTTGTRLSVILPTVMAFLRIGNSRHLVRILLDGGSQASLVREGIFPGMERGIYQNYELTLVGGNTITRKLRLIDCHIEDLEGKRSFPLTLTEIDKPCGDVPIVQDKDLLQYGHLTDIEFSPAPSTTIDVLLGVDNTHLMIWEEFTQGQRCDDPVAVRCPLGWYIQGGRSTTPYSLVNYLNVSAVSPIEECIGLETSLESEGYMCESNALNEDAMRLMEESETQLQDGSSEIQFPRERSPEESPDEFDNALAIETFRHVIKHHAPEDDEVNKVVKDLFYMDNLSHSVNDVDEVLELKSKPSKTLTGGKSGIGKWQSNCREVCDADEVAPSASVLGTTWNLSSDTQAVKPVIHLSDELLTKWKILSHTAIT